MSTAFVLLLATGCTTNNSDESAELYLPETSNPTVVEQGAAPETVPTPAVVSEEDARVLLATALEQYKEGYRFEATVLVGSEAAATITGFVVGMSAQMDVTSGDGTVTYVITPDRSWIQVENGEWHEIDSRGPIEPPLDKLASPNSLTAVESNNGDISMVAVYDGYRFDSKEQVELHIEFIDGLLVSASYKTANATVTTTFAPLDGATIKDPTEDS